MAAAGSAAGGARRTRQRERQEADAPATGSGAVRGELERQPHDPFEVDPRQALEALRMEWGRTHSLVWHEGLYCAQRTGPAGKPYGPVLTGQTPDEIEQELRRDWGEA